LVCPGGTYLKEVPAFLGCSRRRHPDTHKYAQEQQHPGQPPGGVTVGQHGSNRYDRQIGLTRMAVTRTVLPLESSQGATTIRGGPAPSVRGLSDAHHNPVLRRLKLSTAGCRSGGRIATCFSRRRSASGAVIRRSVRRQGRQHAGFFEEGCGKACSPGRSAQGHRAAARCDVTDADRDLDRRR